MHFVFTNPPYCYRFNEIDPTFWFLDCLNMVLILSRPFSEWLSHSTRCIIPSQWAVATPRHWKWQKGRWGIHVQEKEIISYYLGSTCCLVIYSFSLGPCLLGRWVYLWPFDPISNSHHTCIFCWFVSIVFYLHLNFNCKAILIEVTNRVGTYWYKFKLNEI